MFHRLLLATVLVVGALSGFVQGGTVAHYTSAVESTGNRFTAGTVTLSTSKTSTMITLSNILPGDRVTMPLTVSNAGNLDLRYALSSTVTNADSKALGAQLQLTLKSGVTTCTNAGFSADGSVLYGSAALGNTSGALNLIGNPSAFPNGGRSLTAGNNEVLCFQVSLPSGTGTGFQGASTTVTFTFLGQQVSGS